MFYRGAAVDTSTIYPDRHIAQCILVRSSYRVYPQKYDFGVYHGNGVHGGLYPGFTVTEALFS
jgi:hypothetical protein